MAIRNLIAGGLGFFPGSGKWIVTWGLSSAEASPGVAPGDINAQSSSLKVPQGEVSRLLLPGVEQSHLTN